LLPDLTRERQIRTFGALGEKTQRRYGQLI
jgi:hypothetical protein